MISLAPSSGKLQNPSRKSADPGLSLLSHHVPSPADICPGLRESADSPPRDAVARTPTAAHADSAAAPAHAVWQSQTVTLTTPPGVGVAI